MTPGSSASSAPASVELAHLEAELARRPAEHGEHRALDLLAAQRVDGLGGDETALDQHVRETAAELVRLEPRAFEQRAGDDAARGEELTQVGRAALGVRLADHALAEHDLALAGVTAQPEHARLAGQMHDLEQVSQAQIFETSHQAHRGRFAPANPSAVGRKS